MQTNYNIVTPRVNPAFGAVNYDQAKTTLKAVLNLAQTKEFREIVDKHAANEVGHVVLFGEGKKLYANVFAEINYHDKRGRVGGNMSRHRQHFFESALSFVKRMCKIADKTGQEYLEKREKAKLLDI